MAAASSPRGRRAEQPTSIGVATASYSQSGQSTMSGGKTLRVPHMVMSLMPSPPIRWQIIPRFATISHDNNPRSQRLDNGDFNTRCITPRLRADHPIPRSRRFPGQQRSLGVAAFPSPPLALRGRGGTRPAATQRRFDRPESINRYVSRESAGDRGRGGRVLASPQPFRPPRAEPRQPRLGVDLPDWQQRPGPRISSLRRSTGDDAQASAHGG